MGQAPTAGSSFPALRASMQGVLKDEASHSSPPPLTLLRRSAPLSRPPRFGKSAWRQVRNHEGKVIVKDGYMPKTTFPIPPGRTVTFRARLKGVGYLGMCHGRWSQAPPLRHARF